MISQYYFAMEIRGPAKHLLGNNDYTRGRDVSQC